MLARISAPSNAYLVKSGKYLISVDTEWSSSATKDNGDTVDKYITTIDVFDMSNPPAPVKVDTIVTDKLSPSYNYYNYYGGMEMDACIDCGMRWWGGYNRPSIEVVKGGVVFVQIESKSELLGKEHVCYSYPRYTASDTSCDSGDCPYYSGGITCRTLDQGAEVCSGKVYRCDPKNESVCCTPVDDKEYATLLDKLLR